MSKRSKCRHDNPVVRFDGCYRCVQDAVAGAQIVGQARDQFGIEPWQIVNLIRKDQGLDPLREAISGKGGE